MKYDLNSESKHSETDRGEGTRKKSNQVHCYFINQVDFWRLLKMMTILILRGQLQDLQGN